jgi:uncharacterized MAPEG superfamily protein
MQRSVDHHRHVDHRQAARRRPLERRPDPRTAKTFGFSPRQLPFLYVLVGNWIFSAAFFGGVKLFWHWVPTEWTGPDRMALVVKDCVFAVLPGVIGICIVAAQRLNPKMWVGRMAKPGSALDINTRYILNTFEQFIAFFVSQAGLALYCPPEEARSLVILTILFVAGRILFWFGYHYNPYLRAFGFGIGFYPTVAAFAWLMMMMVFGIRIPL